MRQTLNVAPSGYVQTMKRYLDVETTGIGVEDEIVEVAVLDEAGELLFQTLLRPVLDHSSLATEIHGITAEELATAPLLPEVAEQLAAVLAGAVVVCHNAEFDTDAIQRACTLHGVPAPAWASVECTMAAAAERFRPGRRISLHDTMNALGLESPLGRAHRAARDAECARRVHLALQAG